MAICQKNASEEGVSHLTIPSEREFIALQQITLIKTMKCTSKEK